MNLVVEAVGTVENSEWNGVEWRVFQASVGMWKIMYKIRSLPYF